MKTYKHWRLDEYNNQILWLCFDKQDAGTNTLNKEVMEELSAIVTVLADDKIHEGVVIYSGKKNGFIAGADISQFEQFKNIDEAVDLLKQGQFIFNKIRVNNSNFYF